MEIITSPEDRLRRCPTLGSDRCLIPESNRRRVATALRMRVVSAAIKAAADVGSLVYKLHTHLQRTRISPCGVATAEANARPVLTSGRRRERGRLLQRECWTSVMVLPLVPVSFGVVPTFETSGV